MLAGEDNYRKAERSGLGCEKVRHPKEGFIEPKYLCLDAI